MKIGRYNPPLMRRKLFNLGALISLVLCVGACALWIRSYFAEDALEWTPRTSRWDTKTLCGQIRLRVTTHWPWPRPIPRFESDPLGPEFRSADSSLFGFAWEDRVASSATWLKPGMVPAHIRAVT